MVQLEHCFHFFLFSFEQSLTKEKAKSRTFANELGARLQSAVNGNHISNKSGTLRKRPTNDESREWNFKFFRRFSNSCTSVFEQLNDDKETHYYYCYYSLACLHCSTIVAAWNIADVRFFFCVVFQSQQSNDLPNGTLFQVKVAYSYTPVHDDELTIKPNDIIHVTRLVCSFGSLRIFALTSEVFRWKKGGTKGHWMGN